MPHVFLSSCDHHTTGIIQPMFCSSAQYLGEHQIPRRIPLLWCIRITHAWLLYEVLSVTRILARVISLLKLPVINVNHQTQKQFLVRGLFYREENYKK